MPPIISQTKIQGGYQFVTSVPEVGTFTITTADFQGVPNMNTNQDFENYINNVILPKKLTFVDAHGNTVWYFYAKVHVTSWQQDQGTMISSWTPIPDNWWVGLV